MGNAVQVYASLHYARFISLHIALREAIRYGRWQRASALSDRILEMVYHQ